MFKLDPDVLTLEEIEILEDYTGIGVGELESYLADDSTPRGKFLTVAAFLIMRKDNPALTIEEVRKMPAKLASELVSGPDEPEADLPKDSPAEDPEPNWPEPELEISPSSRPSSATRKPITKP